MQTTQDGRTYVERTGDECQLIVSLSRDLAREEPLALALDVASPVTTALDVSIVSGRGSVTGESERLHRCF